MSLAAFVLDFSKNHTLVSVKLSNSCFLSSSSHYVILLNCSITTARMLLYAQDFYSTGSYISSLRFL
jgi:hypothetical protein